MWGFKTQTRELALFTAVPLLLFACSHEEAEKPAEIQTNGYAITADLEFSSGKTVALKANSVISFLADPCVTKNDGDTWVWTHTYQMKEEGIQYRICLKAMIKDGTGSYNLYTNKEDYLEKQGWYIELTIKSKDRSADEHYQSRFEEGGSGKLIINSLTSDRLNGTFSADIPMSPFNGDRLKIKDGKINTKIKRIN